MSNDLIEQLQRLAHGFSAPCASEEAAKALFAAAAVLKTEAHRVALPDPAEVSSTLATLLQHFGTLKSALRKTCTLSAALRTQFNAACVAIYGCAQLARRLPPRHNDSFRLASSLAVVFDAGPAALQQRASNAAGVPELFAVTVLECCYQLVAVSAVLKTATNLLTQPEAAAAFVRTAGRPDAVLPWLGAVSQVLLAVPEELTGARIQQLLGGGDPATGWHARTLVKYASVVQLLLAYLPDAYNTAVQQSPATQQAVLSVLLDRCLPLLAADSSADTLADETQPVYDLALCLGYALDAHCLEQGLTARMQQPTSAAYIRKALQMALSVHAGALR
ncbi:hypothetical protein COHA_002000 [Chlorella ohadii]|uniref:Uncharacterized protein n=1 Tax=Chlorella ohadii TaxID=2649997 RepID=A0AAD5DWM0_9CHLO|nr:hypothetical protein COHA_002000 [Chlorella ohadii]